MCGVMGEPSKMEMDRMKYLGNNKRIHSATQALIEDAILIIGVFVLVGVILAGCGGSDGRDGVDGSNGTDGQDAIVNVEPTPVIVNPTPVEIIEQPHDSGRHQGQQHAH